MSYSEIPGRLPNLPDDLKPYVSDNELLMYGVTEEDSATWCGKRVPVFSRRGALHEDVRAMILELAQLRKAKASN